MQTKRPISTPQRTSGTARRVDAAVVIQRANALTIAMPARRQVVANPAPPASTGLQLDPYVDYGRMLTAEGGILLSFKDVDVRWRQTIWRISVWSVATGLAGWFLLGHSPVRAVWINIVALLVMAILNWLIVRKPVQIYRRIEVRPDCLIIDGTDLYWARYMEGGWPSFRADKDGNQVLAGIYGTRFVEYFTARRFDEQDRGTEVLAAHLQDAMRQLWMRST